MNASIVMGIMDMTDVRAKLVQKLNSNGILVVAWLLLDKDKGYWMNMDNYLDVIQRYNEFKVWTRKYQLKWAGFGLDLEGDFRNLVEIQQGRWDLLIESLIYRFTPERLEKARQTYESLVHDAKLNGWIVSSYTLPIIYDERAENTTLIQRITGIVDVREGIDFEAPMLYSTLFPYGLGVLASYSDHIDAVAVGLTGQWPDFQNQSYANWDDFQMDLLYAYNVIKAPYIGIYSWEATVARGWVPLLMKMNWNQQLTQHQLQKYINQKKIVDEQRESIKGLLFASKDPNDAWKWLKQHPFDALKHIVDFVLAYYRWNNHLPPSLKKA